MKIPRWIAVLAYQFRWWNWLISWPSPLTLKTRYGLDEERRKIFYELYREKEPKPPE